MQTELHSLREELCALTRRVEEIGSRTDRQSGLGRTPGPESPKPGPGRRVPSRPLTRRPTVSVVIPCHNYARFLPAAVGSAISQAGVDVDVLIIDDCSTDGTAELGKSLAAANEQIRCVVHPRNLGHVATYNEGIAAVDGEYLVLLSADDLLAAGSLARATALLEAHPSVGFAYGNVVRFEGDATPGARQGDEGWTIWAGRDWIEERCRAGSGGVHSPEVVMRTSVQRQIGEYRPELPHSGDMEMWLRAACVADVGRIEGADAAFYRVHGENLSHSLCPGPCDDLRARHDAFAAALSAPPGLDGAQWLYAQARWSLAAKALWLAAENYETLAAGAVEELEAFALQMAPNVRGTPGWLHLELLRAAARLKSSTSGTMAGQVNGGSPD